VKRVAVAVLLLALVGVAGCGGRGRRGDDAGHGEPSRESRSALARILQVPEDHPIWEGSIGAVVADLIRLRQFAEIEFVDSELRRKGEVLRRRTLHHKLAAASADPEVLALLRRLAARDPIALRLAPYREGGIAHLLGVLEDEGASVEDRMNSARLLGQFGGLPEMRRMEPLSKRSDETMLETPNEPWPPETLGNVVRESIRRLREREGGP
jgi:hypothetical protein